MNRNNVFLTKEETNFIKSVAVGMMMIHHFVGFPGWRVSGIPFSPGFFNLSDGISMSQAIAIQFKICVAIFAVLTGYGWGHSKSTINKIVKRIVKILLVYEVCLGFGYLLNALIDPSFMTKHDMLNQISVCLFGGTLWIGFAWYIQFFLLAVLTYPLLVKFTRSFSNKYMSLIMSILPFWTTYIIFSKMGILSVWNGILIGYLVYMPCVMIGTWIFLNEKNLLKINNTSYKMLPLWCLLLVLVLYLRYLLGGRLYFDSVICTIFDLCFEKYICDIEFK